MIMVIHTHHGMIMVRFPIRVIIFFSTSAQAAPGVGSAMIFLTRNPIFVVFFEGKEIRITSILESALGLGIFTGPALSSLLFSLGGYQLPFTVVGGAEVVFSLVCMMLMIPRSMKTNYILLDNNKEPIAGEKLSLFSDFDMSSSNGSKSISTSCSVKTLFTNFSIVCACLPTLMMALGSGCITVTLAPFLLEQFDIGSKQSLFYFLCFGATYTEGAFIVEFFRRQGYSFHRPVIFLPLGFLGYLSLGCMHFIPWIKADIQSSSF